MVTIGLGVSATSITTDIVRPDLFGGIVVNKGSFETFVADAQDLNLGFLRYPGGTISEKGWVSNGTISLSKGPIDFADLAGDRAKFAYDLTHPELFAPELLKEDGPASLSDLFALARQEKTDVGVIVPVARYIEGVDFSDAGERAAAIAQFKADLGVFLDRLEAGAFNGGDYPGAMLLEIGNEVYGHPVEYALLAKAVLEELAEHDIPGLEIGVSLQMGRGSADYAALAGRGYFAQFMDDKGGWALPELKGAPGLPGTYAQRISYTDKLMQKILGPELGGVASLRHHILGFDEDVAKSGAIYAQREAIFASWQKAVIAAGGAEPEYYASAWTVDSSNTRQEPFSAAASGNLLELFREFLGSGVDRAALWGIMGAWGYGATSGSTPVATFSNQEGMAPHAALFALMAGKLPDSFAIDIAATSDAVDAYAYAGAAQVVIYLDVREAGPGGIRLDLSSFGSYRSAHVTTVGAAGGASHGLAEVKVRDLVPNGFYLTLPKVAAHSVIEIVLEDRKAISIGPGRAEILHDMGEIIGRDIVAGMKVDLLALSDYEDRHIIGSLYADKLLGGIQGDRFSGRGGDDVIWGRAGADLLKGNGGRDILKGNARGDSLFGGGGADRLSGDAGADLLKGGAGRDRLYGGGGADTLFGEGHRDILSGGAGGDMLAGGVGDDLLHGGAGDDVLYGGAGADRFVFAAGDGTDRIRDFDPSEGDVLDLRALDLASRRHRPGELLGRRPARDRARPRHARADGAGPGRPQGRSLAALSRGSLFARDKAASGRRGPYPSPGPGRRGSGRSRSWRSSAPARAAHRRRSSRSGRRSPRGCRSAGPAAWPACARSCRRRAGSRGCRCRARHSRGPSAPPAARLRRGSSRAGRRSRARPAARAAPSAPGPARCRRESRAR